MSFGWVWVGFKVLKKCYTRIKLYLKESMGKFSAMKEDYNEGEFVLRRVALAVKHGKKKI